MSMSKYFSEKQHYIFTVRGNNPGRTTAIVAGVHGNEPGGVKALERAITLFPITHGVVHYVIGNPEALRAGKRFLEINLNRAFLKGDLANRLPEQAYERRRAIQLMPLFDTCDALLDLHSVSNKQATPFVICEKEFFNLARKFPFPIRSSGWNAIEPGSTDYYMSTINKIGVCLECGFHNDPSVEDRAIDGIHRFLSLMGNIISDPIEDNMDQKEINATFAYVTKKDFKLTRKFNDFELVKKDEPIGHDGGEEYRTPYNCVVIFARDIAMPGQEAVILGV